MGIHCIEFAVKPATPFFIAKTRMALPSLSVFLQVIVVVSLTAAAPLAWASGSLHRRSRHHGSPAYHPRRVIGADVDWLEFPLNLEYLEAEFFLWSAAGYGLDHVAPQLPEGGPPPIGAQLAHLDSVVREVILEFAYQEVGHLRALKKTVTGFPRPQLDLSATCSQVTWSPTSDLLVMWAPTLNSNLTLLSGLWTGRSDTRFVV